MDRSDFLLNPDVVFLNHGSFGACPKEILDEEFRWQQLLEKEPVAFFHALPERMQQAREQLAQMVGARRTDLVFVTNSTYGANVMAYAMARYLNAGDEILLTDHEYGACRRAWEFHLQGTGITISTVAIPIPVPDAETVMHIITKAITGKTRAVFISHITSPTAARMPVERLAEFTQRQKVLLLVDGAHALGHIDLDLGVLGADMYTANCHKWMCMPKGSGMLWVAPHLQQHVPPLIGSWGNTWTSVNDGTFIDEHEYLGTRDPSCFLTIHAAQRWMKKSNWNKVISDSHLLVQYGVQALCSLHNTIQPVQSDWEQHRLMMGSVLVPMVLDSAQFQRVLLEKYSIQCICLTWLDATILRFSIHGYTTQPEVDALVKAVALELGL